MTPDERETLQVKGMLASPHRPSTRLHPTLKACKCEFIGTRSALYKHFDLWQHNMPTKAFFADHGEVPLNIDDPRIALTEREADTAANGRM